MDPDIIAISVGHIHGIHWKTNGSMKRRGGREREERKEE